jgi:ubiquinone/menaquinone biosynthesis C-methylase UbiE
VDPFNVRSLNEARRIILTGDTEERWATETPYLWSLLPGRFDRLLLDYGCGLGRMVKPWLAANPTGHAIGVDSSQSMRHLAIPYVGSGRFQVIPPNLMGLVPPRIDLALAVWVLQHIPNPTEVLRAIQAVLRAGGTLFLVNMHRRALPTPSGWADDGLDIRQVLRSEGWTGSANRLDPAVVGHAHVEQCFWGLYAPPPNNA